MTRTITLMERVMFFTCPVTTQPKQGSAEPEQRRAEWRLGFLDRDF